jgi:hypothetical protein
MKISQSLIAAAVIAVLPFSAFAGDKDKTPAPMGTTASAQFNLLDTNSDGRISQAEATRDSKIAFASVDKNSDGYIDSVEFAHRDMTKDSTMPTTGNPANEPAQPRQ